jgi:hypothetical protein
MRWLNLWMYTLVPHEPLILDGDRWPPNFPEQLPRSVKHWCITMTAVNVIVLVVATLVLRSVVPTIVFILITAAGPIYFALYWQPFIRQLNSSLEKADGLRAMIPLTVNFSIEWCAICALLATPLFIIVFSVAFGASHK